MLCTEHNYVMTTCTPLTCMQIYVPEYHRFNEKQKQKITYDFIL